MQKTKRFISSSVNLHFWPWCNYHCTFCFARNELAPTVLEKRDWIRVIDELADCGVEKVNFAGGEPTLCPWLADLVKHAKVRGLVTSIITNGYGINPRFLDVCGQDLDIAGFSVDASNDGVEEALGRGDGDHVARVISAASLVKARCILVKLNTVVTALNWQDDMSPVLDAIVPDRWKVFQVLKVDGYNDGVFATLAVTDRQFWDYIKRHERYQPVAEDNTLMGDSYCMINPAGRAYQLIDGRYVQSKPILDVGFVEAVAAVGFDAEKFAARRGDYYRSLSTREHRIAGRT